MTAQANVFTYTDAIDALVDYTGGASIDVDQRLLRKCVQNAYREIIGRRKWRHLWDHRRVNLNALYATGTVQYTHSTRTVDLTSGTFPTWVGPYARIRINGGTTTAPSIYVCQVASRVSGTQVTLTANLNPGSDIAAGATFTIYQDVYPLDGDFRMANEPTTYTTWGSQYIRFQDWQWLEWHANVQGYPVRWTIGPDNINPGGYAMYVAPYPSVAVPYDFTIQRRGRNAFWTGYETAALTGTIAVSAAGTAVTGSATQFASSMVGSILRVQATGVTTLPDGQGGLNPYFEQKVISVVTDTTHLTVANAFDSAYSGSGIRIADPIDFPEMLIEAFLHGCRWQYCLTANKDPNITRQQQLIYREALIHACEADRAIDVDQVIGQLDRTYDRGFYSGTAFAGSQPS